MRPVLLLVGLLSATKAFISVSPARRPASTLLRAEEDGGGPKRSLADAISAFSKGALSREELEGAVKAEEAPPPRRWPRRRRSATPRRRPSARSRPSAPDLSSRWV